MTRTTLAADDTFAVKEAPGSGMLTLVRQRIAESPDVWLLPPDQLVGLAQLLIKAIARREQDRNYAVVLMNELQQRGIVR